MTSGQNRHEYFQNGFPARRPLGEPRASYTVNLKRGPSPRSMLCVCGEGGGGQGGVTKAR